MKNQCMLLLALLFTLSVFAQKGKTITGTIKSSDANQPLEKVSVTEKGTNNVVVSDVNGRYSIVLSTDKAVWVFSFVGFATHEICVGNNSKIDSSLAT